MYRRGISVWRHGYGTRDHSSLSDGFWPYFAVTKIVNVAEMMSRTCSKAVVCSLLLCKATPLADFLRRHYVD